MSCVGVAMNDYAKINQLKSNNEENPRKRHKGNLSGGAPECEREWDVGGGGSESVTSAFEGRKQGVRRAISPGWPSIRNWCLFGTWLPPTFALIIGALWRSHEQLTWMSHPMSRTHTLSHTFAQISRARRVWAAGGRKEGGQSKKTRRNRCPHTWLTLQAD